MRGWLSVHSPRRRHPKDLLVQLAVVHAIESNHGPGPPAIDSKPPTRIPEEPLDGDIDPLHLALLVARRGRWGHYPRNPLGVGWRVGRGVSHLDGIALPNLEDPRRALRVDDLLVTSRLAWARQPMPCSFGWVDPGWFPRCAHAGVIPDVDDAWALPEVARWAIDASTRLPRSPTPRLLWSGASPGLAVAPLSGCEILRAVGLDPQGERILRLPSPPSPPARGQAARWTIHTCALDLPRDVVHTLWRAELPAPRGWQVAGALRRRELVREAMAQWRG